MQTPMSSDQAAALLSHLCPSVPKTLPSWLTNWFQNSKQKHQKKKSLVLDKSLHSFTLAPLFSSYLVQQDYSAAGASGLTAAVSGSVAEASAGFSSPASGAAASSCAFAPSSGFGSSATAFSAPSSACFSSAGASSDAGVFSPSAVSSSPAAAPSSDSFLVFLKENPLSLKEGFLKEKRFFFCFPSSLVDGVPSSGLAEASPLVAAGSFSPLASAPSTFSPPSLGASSVGVLPLTWTSALLASSAAGEASPLVLAWPFSWGKIKRSFWNLASTVKFYSACNNRLSNTNLHLNMHAAD